MVTEAAEAAEAADALDAAEAAAVAETAETEVTVVVDEVVEVVEATRALARSSYFSRVYIEMCEEGLSDGNRSSFHLMRSLTSMSSSRAICASGRRQSAT